MAYWVLEAYGGGGSMRALLARHVSSLGQWISNRLIEKVPEDLAECEFECRRLECREDEWTTCKKRLRAIDPTREGRPDKT